MPRRRKNRTHVQVDENSQEKPPRSFVVRAGDVGKSVAQLVLDMRAVMQPNTATKLRERASNKIRDFVALSGPLHVSHLLIFSRPTESRLSLRVARMPRGPTVSFAVSKFMLAADVGCLARSPKSLSGAILTTPPLLVLNNFPKDRVEFMLLSSTLQHMFPALKVAELKISAARRVVLFSYNPASETIEFRQYAIDVTVAGVTRGVKNLVSSSKKLPNLHDYEDVSEYIKKLSGVIDSDAEECSHENIVDVPAKQPRKKSDFQKQPSPPTEEASAAAAVAAAAPALEKRAIKLTEIGPRLDLSLVKIQEGLCSGEVLYHKFVQKSAAEIEQLRRAKEDSANLKAERTRIQEQNVARKQAEKDRKKQRKSGTLNNNNNNNNNNNKNSNDSDDDDDDNNNDDDDDDDDDEAVFEDF